MEAEFDKGNPMVATFGAVIQGGNYRFGDGLKYDASTATVSVDTAQTVTAGDARPVSSAAVHMEIGNVEALLATV